MPRSLRLSAIVIAAILACVGILYAPFAFSVLDRAQKGVSWARLSDIGQAYGGVSALLSGFALLGVSVSLLMQARLQRISSIQVARGFHFDLLKQAMLDPSTYWPAFGGVLDASTEEIRRRIYLTQAFNYLYANWQLGMTSEQALRNEALPGIFQYEFARKHWRESAEHWARGRRSRSAKRFIEIVNEEHAASVSRPPLPLPPGTVAANSERECWRRSRLSETALTAAGGVVLAGVVLWIAGTGRTRLRGSGEANRAGGARGRQGA